MRRPSYTHLASHHSATVAVPATATATAASFPLYSHHAVPSPTQPSLSSAYPVHSAYGRGSSFTAAEPLFSRADGVSDVQMELEHSMYHEAMRQRLDEHKQQPYVAHAIHVASSSPTPALPRPAVQRHSGSTEPRHHSLSHIHQPPQHDPLPQPTSYQPVMPAQYHGRQESPLSAYSVMLSPSPPSLARSDSHSSHTQQFTHAVEAVKQEALSPVGDDASGVSSPSHDSSSSSNSTSSSSSSSSVSSSGSSSSSVDSPFPLPRNLPVSRDVLSRLAFSFVIHLRVDDRMYLPRSIVTPLTVSISQLLHIATNISTFVAVHSTSATPLTDDASILAIPAVFDRLRDRTARMKDADQLPVFKPSPPALLPRNTPMALTVPPPLRGGGNTSSKRSRSTDECDEAEDEDDGEREVAAGVADPYSIHLLFDLAQDVKACTRLGCVNMLVKKSSRRSCDDCQNNGYQLPTDTLLSFYTPQDSQHPFSHLPPAEQASVRAQLDAAMSAAVDKLEYWKFELPEDEAYLYAFVSAVSARQAYEHFQRLLATDKSQPPLSLISPRHSLDGAVLREAVVDSSTDSEPSVNSQSRSGSGGSSDDPALSDSEMDPTTARRRKNSTSRSTNSNSSVDMLGRSTASTASNSSSSTNSPHTDSDPTSPLPAIATPLCTALAGLLPTYPYSSHLQCVDGDSGLYSLKMKSHFWKLEVRPPINAAQHKGKTMRVKVYKKIGAKRPAEKASSSKRTSASAARGSTGGKYGAQTGAALLPKSRLAQPVTVESLLDQPSILYASSSPAVEHPQHHHSEWTVPPLTAALAMPHPLADSAYTVAARRPGDSNVEVKAAEFDSYAPHRSPVPVAPLPLFTATPATHHYGLEAVDAAGPHFDYDMVLPSFQTDDPLALSGEQAETVESFLSSGYHSEAVRSSVAHNSVLVSPHDHEHLLKHKPIGATLSVQPAHGGEAGGYDGHEARVGVAAPTPVLLVYRDHQQYVRDISHGFLIDRDGSGGSGGAGRDRWGGGDGHHDERKDGSGDHRRGGGGGGGAADDFDGHSGKRRRIDHHQLARDAGPPSSSDAQPAAGSGGDDKKKSLLQDDWLEPWKHAGAVAPTEPPSKLAALLNSQQTPVIWLCLLVALSVVGVVLFTYNLHSTGSTLRLVSMQPDTNLIAFQAKTTMSSAANLFSQMRVASPVFNSWVQEKAAAKDSLYLADDDPTTDMLYPLSSRQLDIVPGSVIGSYSTNNVRSEWMLSAAQRTDMMQVNYTEVIHRCQQSTNTAKAVGDFLVSANALGQAFAYHFLGTPLSVTNTTLNLTATDQDSSTGGTTAATESSTGQAAYNDFGNSSSSSTASYAGGSSGASSSGNGAYNNGDDPIEEYVIDYRSSTLASPPKPGATCTLIQHEVGLAFVRQFLCKAVAGIDSPYTPLLLHQCSRPQFNCTEFIWTVFISNLTNNVFAIETSTYSTDALLIALHYHQQAAVLAPTCASFEIMTQDQLDNFQATATLAQINVGVLVGLVMGASALMAVGVLVVVMAVNGGLKWRADKLQAEVAEGEATSGGGAEEAARAGAVGRCGR